MKTLLSIAAVLMFAVCSAASAATYYVRADGTVVNKANATSPLAAATSMGVANHNANTYSADDVIVLSGRGGDYAAEIVPPSSGTSGHPILYQTEDDYPCNLAEGFQVNSKDYLELHDLQSLSTTGEPSNFEFDGTSTGIVTYNLVARNSSNQSLQHQDTASVTHYNPMCSDPVEECISAHDTASVTVIGGSCAGGGDACIEFVGAPTLVFRDVTFTASSGNPIQSFPNSATGGTTTYEDCVLYPATDAAFFLFNSSDGHSITMRRCLVHSQGAVRGPDWTIGTTGMNFTAEHCVFLGGTGDYLLVFRTVADTTYTLSNCTFYKCGNTGAVIFNPTDVVLVAKNNIFYDCAAESMSGNIGTIDYNCFYASGTARGTNSSVTDPLLGGDYRPQAGSPVIGTGTPLTLGAYQEFYGDGHKNIWDLGAAEYRILPARKAALSRRLLCLVKAGALTAQDYSGSGITGTLTLKSRNHWTRDHHASMLYRGSVRFNGVGYLATGTKSLTGVGGARSFSCWVKIPDMSTATQYLFAEMNANTERGMRVYFGAGLVRAQVGDGSGTYAVAVVHSRTPIDDGAWHHLAFTWDGTTDADKAIVYIDGAAVATATAAAITQGGASTSNFLMGATASGASSKLVGLVGDFRIWNATPLSVADIATLYGGGFTTPPTTWWRFVDGMRHAE